MAVKGTASDRRTQVRRTRPLWECPDCGRAFANTNQTHACGPLDLEHHFQLESPADVNEAFMSFLIEAYAVGEQRHLDP